MVVSLEEPARLTSPIAHLAAPPGLPTDSAPTTSTPTLNAEQDVPLHADFAKYSMLPYFDQISFKTLTYLLL